MIKPRRVLIGTPVYNWSLDCRYADSLVGTERLCMQRGIVLRELYPPGNAIIHDARNELVAAALEYGFDDLIMIDADQDWQPQWLIDLLSYPVDCVGAPIRKKTDDDERYNVKTTGGVFAFMQHPEVALLTADDLALGTGFIRYSRKALQLLWDNSLPYRGLGSDSERRMVFESKVVDGQLVSEDTHACDTLRKFGIRTWLDPKMNPGHVGLKRFVGDFAGWLHQLQMEALDAGQAPEWAQQQPVSVA